MLIQNKIAFFKSENKLIIDLKIESGGIFRFGQSQYCISIIKLQLLIRITNMIVTIHQPNYLPYLGFFDKMKKADVFVIYDDAQFNKSDFQHRNRIRILQGWKWLTVPVVKKHIPINEITIKNDQNIKGRYWYDEHFAIIKENYSRCPYFSQYEDRLKEIYSMHYEKLVDLNVAVIDLIREGFDIKTDILLSSEMGFTSSSTQKIIDIVEALGGDAYISGPMGRSYLDMELFEKHGIELQFQDFKHPVYTQNYEDFVPNLSAIDALFNVGNVFDQK